MSKICLVVALLIAAIAGVILANAPDEPASKGVVSSAQ
jgi:hypothetical protein